MMTDIPRVANKMKKSELRKLIKEVVTEINTGDVSLSKKALEVIKFLRENESLIANDEREKQEVRRVITNIYDILTDEETENVNEDLTDADRLERRMKRERDGVKKNDKGIVFNLAN